jgi:alginate O-acetyltransferase complex protein AlgI
MKPGAPCDGSHTLIILIYCKLSFKPVESPALASLRLGGGTLFQIIAYALTFLLCVVVLAKVRLRKVRLAVLLAASAALYLTWSPWFAAVLATSTVMNFVVGRTLRVRHSSSILCFGILLNLVVLGAFKYLPEATVHLPFSSLQRFSHLAMPVGISFWTFQAMSYLFDVFQGEEIDPSFLEFALYMAFFPVTISGPVCRLSEMLPQFRSEDSTRRDDLINGFRRIAIGVLMMQLAKLLGQGILAGDGISSGFDRVTHWSGADAWCLAFGYGLQLFFDFAGYSHIAIGAAKALGIAIPENFARPFTSTSASMFWTRWHMSLSFWIRDYVFFPMMQMRREAWWRNSCFLISMTVFGLWHKASVLFLLWGFYHGILLVLHRQVEAIGRKYDWTPPERLWNGVSWVVTMCLVNLAWILFRANSLARAHQMLAGILSPASYGEHVLSGSLYLLVATLAGGYAIVLLVINALDQSLDNETTESRSHVGPMAVLARWRWFWITPLYGLALLVLLFVTLSRGASTAQLMYGNF